MSSYTNGVETSSSIMNLAKGLAQFQGEVESVPKDANNPFFKSRYASLDAIVKTIKKPLANCGLSITQVPSGDSLVTILMHVSGEFIMASYLMNPKDKTPQSIGSAITYMRRYAISAVLGIATEDDDDANAAMSDENLAQATKKWGKV